MTNFEDGYVCTSMFSIQVYTDFYSTQKSNTTNSLLRESSHEAPTTLTMIMPSHMRPCSCTAMTQSQQKASKNTGP